VIRVLLLDDHRVFTQSLALSLAIYPDLTCVAVAHTVSHALRTADRIEFDVAVVDLHLPGGDGFTAISGLLGKQPEVKVLVLTAHPRVGVAERAFAAGATGFLGKNAGLDEIVTGILSVAAGRRVLGAELDDDRAREVRLTPREQEVLGALSRGLDARRIASSLGISLFTARDHIRSLMSKLGVSTQLDAVVTADRLGLVSLGVGF
jgi:DNA-binding NarL/FixJ family response regulator